MTLLNFLKGPENKNGQKRREFILGVGSVATLGIASLIPGIRNAKAEIGPGFSASMPDINLKSGEALKMIEIDNLLDGLQLKHAQETDIFKRNKILAEIFNTARIHGQEVLDIMRKSGDTNLQNFVKEIDKEIPNLLEWIKKNPKVTLEEKDSEIRKAIDNVIEKMGSIEELDGVIKLSAKESAGRILHGFFCSQNAKLCPPEV